MDLFQILLMCNVKHTNGLIDVPGVVEVSSGFPLLPNYQNFKNLNIEWIFIILIF